MCENNEQLEVTAVSIFIFFIVVSIISKNGVKIYLKYLKGQTELCVNASVSVILAVFSWLYLFFRDFFYVLLGTFLVKCAAS